MSDNTLPAEVISEILRVRELVQGQYQEVAPDGYWSSRQYVDGVNAERAKKKLPGISLAQAQRDLKRAFEAGTIERIRKGRNFYCRYKTNE